MVEVVEPDLIAKHTLYAVAWGIVRLPAYAPGMQAETQRVARERVRIKRACIAYAKARGFDLMLRDNWDTMETWSLSWWSSKETYNSFVGPLQHMCLKIVEHDTWPGGKPEDTP